MERVPVHQALHIHENRARVLVVSCCAFSDVLRSRLNSLIDTPELAPLWGCSCLLFCDVTSEIFKTHGYHRRCSLGECLTSLISLVLHDCCGLFSASYHSSFLECSSTLPPSPLPGEHTQKENTDQQENAAGHCYLILSGKYEHLCGCRHFCRFLKICSNTCRGERTGSFTPRRNVRDCWKLFII